MCRELNYVTKVREWLDKNQNHIESSAGANTPECEKLYKEEHIHQDKLYKYYIKFVKYKVDRLEITDNISSEDTNVPILRYYWISVYSIQETRILCILPKLSG